MNNHIQPFYIFDLAIPTLFIVCVGFIVSYLVVRKPHWALSIGIIKGFVFLIYYGVLFDGTFSFLDDWTYLNIGKDLLASGVSVTNMAVRFPELFSAAGGIHFVYYLYNADSFRIFGPYYYSPVSINIALTYVVAGLFVGSCRNDLAISRYLASGLFVFIVLHPDILAWSTVMNGKDTLVMAGTALATYAVSLAANGRYGFATTLAMVIGVVLFFTRFYVPLLLIASLLTALLLSPNNRQYGALWFLAALGLIGLVLILGLDQLFLAYGRLQEEFVNPLYGIPRILLTPIPFNTSEHYAFLNFSQIFHWLMMPVMLYGMVCIWLKSTLTARFIVLYFLMMIFLYGMFGQLQGPRHRYQLDGFIALFQFFGILMLWKQRVSKFENFDGGRELSAS